MDPVKIGIAGGTGGMGQWFENYFTQAGHAVKVAGRKTRETYEDLVRDCDVVILSMPQKAAMEVAGRVGPAMREDQLLMDFCSQKAGVVAAMAGATRADVIGTHPMFGPSIASLAGQNIILCPARNNHNWLSWVESVFADGGAVVTRMEPEEHDRKMALAQSLKHFLTVSLARMLQTLDIRPDDAFLYATPIFRLNINLIGRLLAQDLSLYADLVSGNPQAPVVVDHFLAAMEESRQVFFSGDEQAAAAYLAEIQKFFGDDFCKKALEETSRVIDAMYRS